MSTKRTRRPIIQADAIESNAEWSQAGALASIHDAATLRTMLRRAGMPIALFKVSPVYHANVAKRPWLKDL